MTNEEFQNLVLKELGSIKEGQERIEDRLEKVEGRLEKVEDRLEKVEDRLEKVEDRLEKVEDRLEKVEHKLDSVHEQTAVLTEFKTETNMKLDNLLEENRSIHEIVGRHEVAIASLKRRAV